MEYYNETALAHDARAVVVLKLLWKKFLKQRFSHQIITFVFIMIMLIWIIVFYSSFLIWKIFSFFMTKVVLRIVEWYLKREEGLCS
ncbi:MAG: hypothetical protein BGO43_06945 [Gammaproteobacteria bacterium 39-13]|nr:hypothetical protein [Gammaproteobacteria bacterium]OJV90572.1 MAG: hypothetical protein BGO43_06945 [Gammaproteobacteria bacterium 39-13]